jgi:Ceramidase
MRPPPKWYILLLLTAVAVAGVFAIPHIPQSAGYHEFCDTRAFAGIPNFGNVISNLPFVIIGFVGLLSVKKSAAPGNIAVIYIFLFTGIVLTGFGSAYYHEYPDNNTLVFDRLPMTLVFMSLLAAIIAESIDPKIGALALPPLLLTGIASVLWWHYTESAGSGDLRLYVLVQYYPMILIPAILILFPPPAGRLSWMPLVFAAAWYGTAKIFERW